MIEPCPRCGLRSCLVAELTDKMLRTNFLTTNYLQCNHDLKAAQATCDAVAKARKQAT